MNTPNSVPLNAYPLSSEKGEAIPLTVLRPLASRVIPAGIGAYTLPPQFATDDNLVMVRSAAECMIGRLGAGAIDGWFPDSLICSPDVDYYLMIDRKFFIISQAPVYVTVLTKWAQMANTGAYRSL